MEPQLEQIREQQKQSWNKFSPGWKKWDTFNMEFLRPMGEAIIQHLDLQNNDLVLDIASGTGEPGLTIAKLVPNGKVTAIDLSEDMLVIAAENAEAKGLKNFETLVADVSELPFETQTFDAISLQDGLYVFPGYAIGREGDVTDFKTRRQDCSGGLGRRRTEQLGNHIDECHPKTCCHAKTFTRRTRDVSLRQAKHDSRPV